MKYSFLQIYRTDKMNQKISRRAIRNREKKGRFKKKEKQNRGRMTKAKKK